MIERVSWDISSIARQVKPLPTQRLAICDLHGSGRAPAFTGLLSNIYPNTSFTSLAAEQSPSGNKHPNIFVIEEMGKHGIDISQYPVKVMQQSDINGTDMISFVPPSWSGLDLTTAKSVIHIYFQDPYEIALKVTGKYSRSYDTNKPHDVDLKIAIKHMYKEFTKLLLSGDLSWWIEEARKKGSEIGNNRVLETINYGGYSFRFPIDFEGWYSSSTAQ